MAWNLIARPLLCLNSCPDGTQSHGLQRGDGTAWKEQREGMDLIHLTLLLLPGALLIMLHCKCPRGCRATCQNQAVSHLLLGWGAWIWLSSSFGFILLSLFYCCQLSIWGWHADILTWLIRVENFLSEAEQCLEPFLFFPFFPGNLFIYLLASHCIKLTWVL